MGFEDTDKQTAQEVPLLFQGSTLILLYIQVLLGRYQPQGLPTGPEHRLTDSQHTWNLLPVSTRGGGGTERDPFSLPATLPPAPGAPRTL